MTDRDFNRYLEGDSPLSRAYQKASTEQPPASIDARVKRELHSDHDELERQRRRTRRWHHYTVPLAAAATVVLSFSLVMQLVLDSAIDLNSTGEMVAMDQRRDETISSPSPLAGNGEADAVQSEPGAPAGISEERFADDTVAAADAMSDAGHAAARLPADLRADPMVEAQPSTQSSVAESTPVAKEMASVDAQTDRFAANQPDREQQGRAKPGDLPTVHAEPTPTESVQETRAASREEATMPPGEMEQGPMEQDTMEQGTELIERDNAGVFASAPPTPRALDQQAGRASPDATVASDGSLASTSVADTVTLEDCLLGSTRLSGKFETQVAAIRCHIATDDTAQAQALINELIETETAFDLDDYPDLADFVEAQ